MKRSFVKSALLGFPLGITIGYTLSIIFSIVFGGGYYGAVHPELSIILESEINAVIVQAILWGSIGLIFSGASIIWERDDWSLVKQTIVVFSVYLITILPIALILRWINLSLISIMVFVALFIVIFFLIWVVVHLKIKSDIKALNKEIKDTKITDAISDSLN